MKTIPNKVYHEEIDWHNINISQPVDKTMEQTGLSEYHVRLQRERAGVMRKYKKNRANWRNVDLLQPTEKLMNDFGVTEKQINDARRIRGLLEPKNPKFPVVYQSPRTLMKKKPAVVKKKRLALFFFSLSQLFS